MGIETLTQQFETITLTINIINLILTVSASIAILLISENYRDSAFSKCLIYFFGSVSQMGLVQLFFLLIKLAIVRADPPTVSLIWHLSYYLSLVLFFLAVRTLISITQLNKIPVSSNRTIAMVVVSIFASLIMLGAAEIIQSTNRIYPLGTRMQDSGIYHYFGLILTIAVVYYNSQIASKITGAFGIIVTPLFYSLIVLCFIHIFELASETWMIFSIDYDLVEGIEIWLWLPVFICLNYSFWKLYALLKSNKRL